MRTRPNTATAIAITVAAISCCALLPTRALASPVEVKAYVMSKCPFASRVLPELAKLKRHLGGNVSIDVDYIVTVKSDGSLKALHGREELAGNRLGLCALEHLSKPKALDFISCMAKDYRKIPHNWTRCVSGYLAREKIRRCQTNQALSLLRESAQRSSAARATGSPTLYIGGKRFSGQRDLIGLSQAVCKAMTQKPPACRKLPKPTKVKLIVINDKRCKKCKVQGMIRSLKARFFPGMVSRIVDYSSAEGKRLYANTASRFLPIYLFESNVTQARGYPRIQRWMKKSGKYQRLKMPAHFDPTAEICDNGKDDTGNGKIDCADPTCTAKIMCRKSKPLTMKMFIMSQCPFAAKALQAMPEVRRKFAGRLKFDVHYIATRKADGSFKALHGASEVEENKRQLCAKKHAPRAAWFKYITCRANDYRSKKWRACLPAAYQSRVAGCTAGPEGTKLLANDIKLGHQLEISGSPTHLINNRFKVSGIKASALIKEICKRNRNAKGC